MYVCLVYHSSFLFILNPHLFTVNIFACVRLFKRIMLTGIIYLNCLGHFKQLLGWELGQAATLAWGTGKNHRNGASKSHSIQGWCQVEARNGKQECLCIGCFFFDMSCISSIFCIFRYGQCLYFASVYTEYIGEIPRVHTYICMYVCMNVM